MTMSFRTQQEIDHFEQKIVQLIERLPDTDIAQIEVDAVSAIAKMRKLNEDDLVGGVYGCTPTLVI